MAKAVDSEVASSSIKREFLLQSSMKWDTNGREEFNGELELSLGLSLGGSIGKAKEKDKDKEGPCLRNFPSGSLQPCLRIFATGNLHGMVEKEESVSMDNISADKEREKQQPFCSESMKTWNPEGKSFLPSMQEIWKNLQKEGKPVSAPDPGASPLSRSVSGAGPFKEVVSLSLPNGSTTRATWPHHVGQPPFNANTPGMVQNGTSPHRILRTCSVGATASGLVPTSTILHKQPSLDVLLPDRKKEGTQTAMQTEILEQQRKREVHAMRRQEARKKREEKQQKKARKDEGKSILQSKPSVSFPVTGSAIPSTPVAQAQWNKWMLNPELPAPQTNQPQMDLRGEGKNVLQSQRSLQRDKDRAAKESDPRSEREKKVKQKAGKGIMGALTCDFASGATTAGKAEGPDPSEINKFLERQASGKLSTPTRNSNSPIKGEIPIEAKNSKEPCENEHKSSNSNGGEVEIANSANGEISGPGRNTSTSCPAPAFSVLPMPYPLQMPHSNAPYMPLPIGFSFPYMMPFWTPATQSAGSESSKSSVSPVSNVSPHAFPSFQMPLPGTLPNWLPIPQNRAVPAPAPAPAPTAGPVQFSGASSGRSSSVAPDQDSGSSEGSSSDDSKSQSSTSVEPSWKGFQSLPRDPSDSNIQGQPLAKGQSLSTSSKLEPSQYAGTMEKVPSTMEIPSSGTSREKQIEALCKQSLHFDSGLDDTKQSSCGHGISQHNPKGQTKQLMKKPSSDTMDEDKCKLKPGLACPKLSGGNDLLPNVHWVSTTGTGPNGITISGILSSYSRSQVRIVCTCHGTQMSPAEFVRHAGSTDLSNPERNIVVSPIPVRISATSAQG